MKPTFIHNLVNKRFEDPSLFVRILREKRAFLFDIGNINRLKPGDLQKITDVFVTHMHIDHFIGFDTLLRALLRREKPLRVYGPANIIDCVEGKLRGYTWNLIKEYPMVIEVFCVKDGKMFSASFHAENCFKRKDNGVGEFTGVILKDPLFTVKALELDHQVPCLSFSIEEEIHININKALLMEMNLPVGPWLSELKKAIRERRPSGTEFDLAGKIYRLEDLRDIVNITEGQKISYVTDVSISEHNVKKIIEFVRDSHTLYCEAYFMDKDIDRALKRYHLTAGIAGRIAREAGVKNLVAMHFSPKYRDEINNPENEAMKEFKNQVSSEQAQHSPPRNQRS
ncbi:MAG: MBL fold metallo-hydrolase [Nitrospirota bacterium]